MLQDPCTCYVACYVPLDTRDRGGYRCKMRQGERNGAKGSLEEIVITPLTTMFGQEYHHKREKIY
jgi:hypothetical protein